MQNEAELTVCQGFLFSKVVCDSGIKELELKQHCWDSFFVVVVLVLFCAAVDRLFV